MNKIVLLFAFMLSPCLAFAQHFSFDFNASRMPAPNGIWTDTAIYLDVTVFAPGRVATVTASAGGRQATLQAYNGVYIGGLNLSGLSGGSLTLVVGATDYLNNSGDALMPFIYRPLNDPAVSVTINSLADGYAATPVLPLGARSAGNKIDLDRLDQVGRQYLITSAM